MSRTSQLCREQTGVAVEIEDETGCSVAAMKHHSKRRNVLNVTDKTKAG